MVEAYLRLGVLGLIAIVFILLVIWLIKKLMGSSESNQEAMMNLNKQYAEFIVEQNKQIMTEMMNGNKRDLEQAVQKITKHIPSSEENAKQTRINENLDDCLKKILDKVNADRVNIVQFHNGGRGLNGQSFLKMSMTNEVVREDIKPFASMFKDQFRTVLGYFVKELNNNGKCFIDDTEDLKNVDVSMYEFLKSRQIKAKYGVAIRNKYDDVIGFLCIEYERRKLDNKTIIEETIKEYQQTIEALLNL